MNYRNRHQLDSGASRWLLFASAILLALFGVGCGGDSDGDTDGPGGGDGPGDGDGSASCSRDSDCGAGFFCDRSSRKDFDCLEDCVFDAMCDFEDDECFFTCADQCGVTCAEICAFDCQGDAACQAECMPACEAARDGGGSPGDNGGPGDDGGTPGDDGGMPGDGGDAPGDGGDMSCAEFCAVQCAGVPAANCASECIAACEGDVGDNGGGGGGGGGGGQGVCRRIPQDTGGGSGFTDTDSGGGQTQAPADMNWIGTWSFEVTYTANCQWTSSAPQPPSDKNYFVTGQLTGSNANITAQFGNYTMTGTGNNERLILSGSFEGRDHRNNTATQVERDNNLEFRITEIVNANTARGSFSGSYDTSGGISCTVADGGTVEITR